jgi:hypothetical protein
VDDLQQHVSNISQRVAVLLSLEKDGAFCSGDFNALC